MGGRSGEIIFWEVGASGDCFGYFGLFFRCFCCCFFGFVFGSFWGVILGCFLVMLGSFFVFVFIRCSYAVVSRISEAPLDFGVIFLDKLSLRRLQNELFFRFVFCIDFWSFFGSILGSFWEAFWGQNRSFWASISG